MNDFADSNNEIYTDSTGIDLYSFIVNTLHKNAKDRIMLLHLEEHMTMLINDNTLVFFSFFSVKIALYKNKILY